MPRAPICAATCHGIAYFVTDTPRRTSQPTSCRYGATISSASCWAARSRSKRRSRPPDYRCDIFKSAATCRCTARRSPVARPDDSPDRWSSACARTARSKSSKSSRSRGVTQRCTAHRFTWAIRRCWVFADLSLPDFGDAVTIADDELPVFWACGVTPQLALLAAARRDCDHAQPWLHVRHGLEGGRVLHDVKYDRQAGAAGCGRLPQTVSCARAQYRRTTGGLFRWSRRQPGAAIGHRRDLALPDRVQRQSRRSVHDQPAKAIKCWPPRTRPWPIYWARATRILLPSART